MSFQPNGTDGYNLHRSSTLEALSTTAPLAFMEQGASSIVDAPPSGPLFYATRTASPCSHASGP